MTDQSGYDSHGNNDDAPDPIELKPCFVPRCGGEGYNATPGKAAWCLKNSLHMASTPEEWNSIPRWGDIERIALEAHTRGRIYTQGGEVEKPADEYAKLIEWARRQV